MAYEVGTRDVASRTLAVARGCVTMGDIGATIRGLLSRVYEFLEQAPVKPSGQNVVLYWDEGTRGLIMTPGGVPIEAGVEVDAPFASGDRVACSATPSGPVAMVVHRGPYENLPEAHAAVRRWCAQHHRAIAGPNWEIYGDWTEDPDERRTDVFYLLK
jgi:effector-binding domain-containing protein